MNNSYIIEFESERSLTIYIRVYSLIFRKRMSPSHINIDITTENTYKASIILDTTPSEAQVIGRQLSRLVGISDVIITKK